MSEKKEKRPVYITYIGNRVYTPEVFEKEAKKIGVSRAIPPVWAKKLKPGDRIYTLFKRGEYALATGYFVLSGYSWTSEQEGEIRRYIREHPDEFGITECYEGSGQTISRGCGSYVAGGGCYTNDLQGAITHLLEVAKEHGWRMKIFANGKYYGLPKKKRVKLPFTRGIAEYYLDIETMPEEPIDKTHIGEMTDYTQITRRRKKKVKQKKLPLKK